jgi:hypothetical protein
MASPILVMEGLAVALTPLPQHAFNIISRKYDAPMGLGTKFTYIIRTSRIIRSGAQSRLLSRWQAVILSRSCFALRSLISLFISSPQFPTKMSQSLKGKVAIVTGASRGRSTSILEPKLDLVPTGTKPRHRSWSGKRACQKGRFSRTHIRSIGEKGRGACQVHRIRVPDSRDSCPGRLFGADHGLTNNLRAHSRVVPRRH